MTHDNIIIQCHDSFRPFFALHKSCRRRGLARWTTSLCTKFLSYAEKHTHTPYPSSYPPPPKHTPCIQVRKVKS